MDSELNSADQKWKKNLASQLGNFDWNNLSFSRLKTIGWILKNWEIDDKDMRPICFRCKGSGRMEVAVAAFGSDVELVTCSECHGTGRIGNHPKFL